MPAALTLSELLVGFRLSLRAKVRRRTVEERCHRNDGRPRGDDRETFRRSAIVNRDVQFPLWGDPAAILQFPTTNLRRSPWQAQVRDNSPAPHFPSLLRTGAGSLDNGSCLACANAHPCYWASAMEGSMTNEQRRLDEARTLEAPWKKWGPYLSERQWGTVREDYSEDGNAWNYFTHDQARSRAYRWGEDGLAGISDDHQILCFALALWNGKDPILKERLFGLTNSEGNHGEDVKEYYFYLDSTPTHSYMKYLYKYPQTEYPYLNLIQTNRGRNRLDMEYELLDTGIFNEDRYFDVFVEYAKQGPEDLLIEISVANRGPEAAEIQVLPSLWFRNTWTWWPGTPKPSLKAVKGPKGIQAIAASHPDLGERSLYCDGDAQLLFTENETNNQRIFGTANTP